MEVKGFIKNIGTPREWQTRDGQNMKSAPIVVHVPQIDPNGRDVSDEILGEISYANDEFLANLDKNASEGRRVSCSIRFGVREYNGKQYPNIRVQNVTLLI